MCEGTVSTVAALVKCPERRGLIWCGRQLSSSQCPRRVRRTGNLDRVLAASSRRLLFPVHASLSSTASRSGRSDWRYILGQLTLLVKLEQRRAAFHSWRLFHPAVQDPPSDRSLYEQMPVYIGYCYTRVWYNHRTPRAYMRAVGDILRSRCAGIRSSRRVVVRRLSVGCWQVDGATIAARRAVWSVNHYGVSVGRYRLGYLRRIGGGIRFGRAIGSYPSGRCVVHPDIPALAVFGGQSSLQSIPWLLFADASLCVYRHRIGDRFAGSHPQTSGCACGVRQSLHPR